MLEDKLAIIKLIDVYGMLLTTKKLEILNDYYFMDISLGEIAENRQISRQAVHDSIIKSIEKLKNYETNLKVIKKEKLLKELINNLKLDKNINDEQYKKFLSILEE